VAGGVRHGPRPWLRQRDVRQAVGASAAGCTGHSDWRGAPTLLEGHNQQGKLTTLRCRHRALGYGRSASSALPGVLERGGQAEPVLTGGVETLAPALLPVRWWLGHFKRNTCRSCVL